MSVPKGSTAADHPAYQESGSDVSTSYVRQLGRSSAPPPPVPQDAKVKRRKMTLIGFASGKPETDGRPSLAPPPPAKREPTMQLSLEDDAITVMDGQALPTIGTAFHRPDELRGTNPDEAAPLDNEVTVADPNPPVHDEPVRAQTVQYEEQPVISSDDTIVLPKRSDELRAKLIDLKDRGAELLSSASQQTKVLGSRVKPTLEAASTRVQAIIGDIDAQDIQREFLIFVSAIMTGVVSLLRATATGIEKRTPTP